jgi:hypothetical protein
MATLRDAGGPLVVLALVIAACGASPAHAPVPRVAQAGGPVLSHAGPGEAATLGPITWHLDQLAPPPGAALSPPVLLAVLRATTAGPADHLRTGAISLLDDAGGRWASVLVSIYVPIDGLDDAPLEPAHGAAGVVAFRLPTSRRGVAVSITGSGGQVILDAPH